MQKLIEKNSQHTWLEAELRLAGLLDRRMIALLRAIDDTGSINQAAKQQGLSYKGAWQIVERANNGAPQQLIDTTIGGSKGGGTRLTAAGRKLLNLFSDLEQQHQRFIEQLNQQIANEVEAVLLLQRMAVKCSSRNQLFGKVLTIKRGAVNAEVMVQLQNGMPIITHVGQTWLDDMLIEVASETLILIDSTSIMVVVDLQSMQFPACNCLTGQILRIQQDDICAEVIITLTRGMTITATITQSSLQELNLNVGQTVHAVFKHNAPFFGHYHKSR